MSSNPYEGARRVLEAAIAGQAFPAAAVDVGGSAGSLWQGALGARSLDPPVPAAIDTPYDLASLTKVVATTTLVMQLTAAQRLQLGEPVSSFFEEWRGPDRTSATIQDLLEHASGLPARLIDPAPDTRREFEHDICAIPLECLPRTQSIYSDLGFILLGFVVEQRGHARLASQFADIVRELRLETDPLTFELDAAARRRAAPTLAMEDDLRRGRMLFGEVHDSYAAALGGAAGHAGLFGTAPAVAAFARIVLRAARGDTGSPPPFTPQLLQRFITKSSVPGSSRALGWDTMLPSSSCGSRMSASAFGHVGFTGTSLWIDPERDRYYVLLTNRARSGGTLDEMRAVRRAFHDALADV
jgi:CubicO group peptidase (beta-lactamase class C family)